MFIVPMRKITADMIKKEHEAKGRTLFRPKSAPHPSPEISVRGEPDDKQLFFTFFQSSCGQINIYVFSIKQFS